MNAFSASFKNLEDALASFADDKELSGSSRLLESARNYAIRKMTSDAAARGANAVIGIDSETSFGGASIHIMIYGTAVRIEPIPAPDPGGLSF